jgi:hypothetical protein
MQQQKVFHLSCTGLAALATIGLGGCFGSPVRSTTQNDLGAVLKDAGWKLLPVADSHFAPGVVIYFPKGAKSPAYRGPLTSCGVPKELLTVSDGTSPTLKTKKDVGVDVNLSLHYLNTQVDPGFARTHTATMDIGSHGSSVIDVIGIDVWRRKPENAQAFDSACGNYFKEDGYYLITEGWRIKDGMVTYYTKNGVGVQVPDVSVSKVLSVGGGTKVTAVNEATATFKDTSYIAIRGVVLLRDGLKTMGSAKPSEIADARLLQGTG